MGGGVDGLIDGESGWTDGRIDGSIEEQTDGVLFSNKISSWLFDKLPRVTQALWHLTSELGSQSDSSTWPHVSATNQIK